MRDAKTFQINGGTCQIQRIVIARQLLTKIKEAGSYITWISSSCLRIFVFVLIHDGEYYLRISKLVCQWIIREMQWIRLKWKQRNEIIRSKLPIQFANRASAIDNWSWLPKPVDKENRRLKSLQTISTNNSYSCRCQLIESRNVFGWKRLTIKWNTNQSNPAFIVRWWIKVLFFFDWLLVIHLWTSWWI